MSDYKTYLITDFPNQKADAARLESEVRTSNIVVAFDTIVLNDSSCSFYFKDDISFSDETVLSGIVNIHSGKPFERIIPPRTVDNKEIMRADSRPTGTNTYFTCTGDNATIGGGKELFWDFSNSDDIVTASGIPSGYKRKSISISFSENVYMKEGSFYFFDALKGSYGEMSIVCPTGHYYYNSDGSLAQAAEDTPVSRFVNKHFFAGNCPMGDELNTEGAQENPIPPNYTVRVQITVPDNDTSSYGWVSLELYKERTILLPGESI